MWWIVFYWWCIGAFYTSFNQVTTKPTTTLSDVAWCWTLGAVIGPFLILGEIVAFLKKRITWTWN